MPTRTPFKKMKSKISLPVNRILTIPVFIVACLAATTTFAQPGKDTKVVDQIIAVVGNNIILLSDLEAQAQQALPQTNLRGEALRCRVLDQLLLQKLLLHQADLDSITVSDDQVEQKINQNMSYFIQQIGSVEKLEQYYGKSIAELKEEFRPVVRDQLLVQQMQSKLTGSVTASPADVKSFLDNVPVDSLPLINAEVEYAQILMKVPVSKEEKQSSREQIDALRTRIVNGDDFSTLAVLYSQDKESAKQGGELGLVNRGDLVPEFEAVAFRLKNTSEVSEVVESPFGFHIIQLIERRGERINCRHILIRPKVTSADVLATQLQADSLVAAIKAGTTTFTKAAEEFSDDKDSKLNEGNVINPASGSTRFEPDQVDPMLLFQLDKMEIGDVSAPIPGATREGDQAYRIIKLNGRTQPHRLNIRDDYQRIQELALSDKQNRILENWRNKRKGLTYIRIVEDLLVCPELQEWVASEKP